MTQQPDDTAPLHGGPPVSQPDGNPPAGPHAPAPQGWGAPPPYGPPPAGQQPAPQYPYYAPARPTNGMAITSLVLGILWIYWLGSILALIFGYVARRQIRERGESGDGLAIAGIVLGWIGVGFLALMVAFFAVGIAAGGI